MRRGFTLFEVIVATAIASFIMLTLFELQFNTYAQNAYIYQKLFVLEEGMTQAHIFETNLNQGISSASCTSATLLSGDSETSCDFSLYNTRFSYASIKR